MCKNFIALFILLALLSPTQAQDKPSAEFGFHAGPSMSLLYNQNPLANPRKQGRSLYDGSAFGIGGQYNFKKIVSLRAELNYERKGDVLFNSNTYSTSEGQSYFTNSYGFERLEYFTIPVTAKLSFGKKVQFFTNIGMYAGFVMGAYNITHDATFNRNDPGAVTTVETTTDISGIRKRVDGGIVTGVGIYVPVWKTVSLNFEARNNLGLVNVNKSFESGWKHYNNSTAFLFGFSVGLGKQTKNTQPKMEDESKN